MRNDFSTDRILLRAPEPEDLELMFSLENEEDACNASVATGPYSRYQLKKYIAESENDLFADHQLRLMIEWKEERKTVGIIDVFDFSPRYRRAELGIIIKKEYRRQKFAHEAYRLLEMHCRNLGFRQLYAYVSPNNISSLRFLQAEGFQVTATLPDWLWEGGKFTSVNLLQKLFV
ncbi:GNAT family N-acetyltransferase [Phocaeicola faecicola]|jgi:diamine N-acetyltransferase|uniref:GNAT family N-acetyltransferase n=1 Tax=Phocaeicola faecicola TaxID=2739389 RepID=UPI0015E756A5|nr:GNAT family N-acetyltransferase [Phocaeicola faecicola]